MLTRLLTLAALALGLSACSSLRAPLTCPADGGPPWVEISSAHFTLRSDLGEAEARAALTDVEAVYVMFKDVVFPSTSDPHDHLQVVAFAREADYKALAPPGSGAYFQQQLPGDLEIEPTLVMEGQFNADKRRTLQHELTHFFTRQSLGAVPVWFSEGTAGYYETLRYEDGWVWFGMRRADRKVYVDTQWDSGRGGTWLVPLGYLPTVPSLVTMDQETFSAMRDPDSEASVRARIANYMGAWGLVHLFHDGPVEYRQRYLGLSARLNAGTPFGVAWKATFGDLSAMQLERAYRAHLAGKVAVHPVPYKPRPASPVGPARQMTPAEVHTLWARLGHWKGKDAQRTGEHVRAAVAHDQTSPDVRFLRGLYAAQVEGDDLAAVAALEQARAARPADARVLLALALALDLRADRLSGGIHGAPKDVRDATDARLAEVVAELTRVATSAPQLDYLAKREERAGRRDAAFSLSLRAVQADPTCASCLETYASLSAAKGDLAEAVSAQERAIAMLGEHRVSRRMIERLAGYVRRSGSAHKPAPAPPPTTAPPPTPPTTEPRPPSGWQREP